MRVQNEGTGKSSWWMINPDAKPGKAARRRATSMETSKYEKKRGRVKKKIEALKNGLSVDQTTPSPSSSVSEGLDMFPDSPLHHAFQLSPEFRPRASSNASSCGRLSPIPAVDNDMHDSQVSDTTFILDLHISDTCCHREVLITFLRLIEEYIISFTPTATAAPAPASDPKRLSQQDSSLESLTVWGLCLESFSLTIFPSMSRWA